MINEYMLTTIDNPFSPIFQYDEWLTWDMANYNSMALLARVVRTSPDLSDADQALAIQQGIEEIVSENVSGVHTRVRVNPEAVGTEDSSSAGDRPTNRAA